MSAGFMLGFGLQTLATFKVTFQRIEEILFLTDLEEKVAIDFEKQRQDLKLKDDTVLFFRDFNGFWPLKKDEKKDKEKGKKEKKS